MPLVNELREEDCTNLGNIEFLDREFQGPESGSGGRG